MRNFLKLLVLGTVLALSASNAGLVTQSGPKLFVSVGSDTTPTAFSFTDQTSVALSSTMTSAAITVAGINAPATITVSGGTYDVNASGSFTGSSGSVNNGDTVRARHTSNASNSTATNTIVTIGGVSDTFTSTTLSSGLSPTPESTGGTTVFDSRAGGAQSTQGATTLAAWKTAYMVSAPPGMVLWDATYGVTGTTITNGTAGGAGVRTRETTFNTVVGDEKASLLGWDADAGVTIIPAGQAYYVQGKMYIPTGITLGGVNPHWKVIFLNKVNGDTGRLYFGIYGTDYMALLVDETDTKMVFDAPGAPSTSVWNCRDQIIQWTAYVDPNSPANGRMWFKAACVTGGEAEATRKPGESSNGTPPSLAPAFPVGGFQENGTLYLTSAGGSLHTWDIVIWYPP